MSGACRFLNVSKRTLLSMAIDGQLILALVENNIGVTRRLHDIIEIGEALSKDN